MMNDSKDIYLSPEEEAQLRALVRSAAAEPPADLCDRILTTAAAERKRMRTAWIRRTAGIAAALLILAPAAAVLVPRLAQNAPEAAADSDACGVIADSVPETNADVLYSDTEASAFTALVPEVSPAAPVTPASGDAPTEMPPENADGSPLPPPDHMMKGETPPAKPVPPASFSTSPDASAPPADGVNPAVPAPPTEEPAYFAVLRELVGEEALGLWMAQYTGDLFSAEAEADAYTYFGLDQ